MAGTSGSNGPSTQGLAIGQNSVVALNEIANAIKAAFPAWQAAPSSASSSGVAGQTAYDTSYFYVCVSSNTWKRAALSTW